ncbi:PepSY domain-containing protein [Devosia sp. 1566]|uniref:PepSY-associated TM helix domain-containing protein n=1 Tax=Devosia sp. 1566 TaxID=2499144 RepID=UPI000FDA60B0|nr:PepSY domain-containing protein [Devosia sp. 1566]
MTIMSSEGAQANSRASSRLYRAVWRWHFYAGLVVVPFFILLACTGMIMLYGNSVETMLGPRHLVEAPTAAAPLVEQAATAAASIPGGRITMFVQAPETNLANKFMVSAEDGAHIVVVDPNHAAVMAEYRQDSVLFNWASKIHGTLLLGDFGDRVLEMAAGLGIVLLLTGLYMWWPRGARTWSKALLPRLTKGRGLSRDLHMSTGFYFAIVLLFFLFSGLAWTGIWGTQIVQAWNTFPAAKLGAPVSDTTHASLNHGDEHDVPWTLEQTPMPVCEPHDHSATGMDHSGMDMSAAGPANLDSIVATPLDIGFTGQFRVNMPASETGVFTISTDSSSGDSANPFGDRTVHIDQYSGEIISEVAFADYGLGGKAMAAGIALHQGNLGWWNIALNLLFCAAVVLIAVSGVVMWWKRRPKGRLAEPLYPKQYRAPRGVIIIAAAVCIAFPLTGTSVIVLALIDFLLPRRFKEAGSL